jgi:hypothetical protein
LSATAAAAEEEVQLLLDGSAENEDDYDYHGGGGGGGDDDDEDAGGDDALPLASRDWQVITLNPFAAPKQFPYLPLAAEAQSPQQQTQEPATLDTAVAHASAAVYSVSQLTVGALGVTFAGSGVAMSLAAAAAAAGRAPAAGPLALAPRLELFAPGLAGDLLCAFSAIADLSPSHFRAALRTTHVLGHIYRAWALLAPVAAASDAEVAATAAAADAFAEGSANAFQASDGTHDWSAEAAAALSVELAVVTGAAASLPRRVFTLTSRVLTALVRFSQETAFSQFPAAQQLMLVQLSPNHSQTAGPDKPPLGYLRAVHGLFNFLSNLMHPSLAGVAAPLAASACAALRFRLGSSAERGPRDGRPAWLPSVRRAALALWTHGFHHVFSRLRWHVEAWDDRRWGLPPAAQMAVLQSSAAVLATAAAVERAEGNECNDVTGNWASPWLLGLHHWASQTPVDATVSVGAGAGAGASAGTSTGTGSGVGAGAAMADDADPVAEPAMLSQRSSELAQSQSSSGPAAAGVAAAASAAVHGRSTGAATIIAVARALSVHSAWLDTEEPVRRRQLAGALARRVVLSTASAAASALAAAAADAAPHWGHAVASLIAAVEEFEADTIAPPPVPPPAAAAAAAASAAAAEGVAARIVRVLAAVPPLAADATGAGAASLRPVTLHSLLVAATAGSNLAPTAAATADAADTAAVAADAAVALRALGLHGPRGRGAPVASMQLLTASLTGGVAGLGTDATAPPFRGLLTLASDLHRLLLTVTARGDDLRLAAQGRTVVAHQRITSPIPSFTLDAEAGARRHAAGSRGLIAEASSLCDVTFGVWRPRVFISSPQLLAMNAQQRQMVRPDDTVPQASHLESLTGWALRGNLGVGDAAPPPSAAMVGDSPLLLHPFFSALAVPTLTAALPAASTNVDLALTECPTLSAPGGVSWNAPRHRTGAASIATAPLAGAVGYARRAAAEAQLYLSDSALLRLAVCAALDTTVQPTVAGAGSTAAAAAAAATAAAAAATEVGTGAASVRKELSVLLVIQSLAAACRSSAAQAHTDYVSFVAKQQQELQHLLATSPNVAERSSVYARLVRAAHLFDVLGGTGSAEQAQQQARRDAKRAIREERRRQEAADKAREWARTRGLSLDAAPTLETIEAAEAVARKRRLNGETLPEVGAPPAIATDAAAASAVAADAAVAKRPRLAAAAGTAEGADVQLGASARGAAQVYDADDIVDLITDSDDEDSSSSGAAAAAATGAQLPSAGSVLRASSSGSWITDPAQRDLWPAWLAIPAAPAGAFTAASAVIEPVLPALLAFVASHAAGIPLPAPIRPWLHAMRVQRAAAWITQQRWARKWPHAMLTRLATAAVSDTHASLGVDGKTGLFAPPPWASLAAAAAVAGASVHARSSAAAAAATPAMAAAPPGQLPHPLAAPLQPVHALDAFQAYVASGSGVGGHAASARAPPSSSLAAWAALSGASGGLTAGALALSAALAHTQMTAWRQAVASVVAAAARLYTATWVYSVVTTPTTTNLHVPPPGTGADAAWDESGLSSLSPGRVEACARQPVPARARVPLRFVCDTMAMAHRTRVPPGTDPTTAAAQLCEALDLATLNATAALRAKSGIAEATVGSQTVAAVTDAAEKLARTASAAVLPTDVNALWNVVVQYVNTTLERVGSAVGADDAGAGDASAAGAIIDPTWFVGPANVAVKIMGAGTGGDAAQAGARRRGRPRKVAP